MRYSPAYVDATGPRVGVGDLEVGVRAAGAGGRRAVAVAEQIGVRDGDRSDHHRLAGDGDGLVDRPVVGCVEVGLEVHQGASTAWLHDQLGRRPRDPLELPDDQLRQVDLLDCVLRHADVAHVGPVHVDVVDVTLLAALGALDVLHADAAVSALDGDHPRVAVARAGGALVVRIAPDALC